MEPPEDGAADETARPAAASGSAIPESSGSAGPGGAGSADTSGAGGDGDEPGSAGTGSAGPRSAEPGAAERDQAEPDRADADTVRPDTPEPEAVGPEAVGPDGPGSEAAAAGADRGAPEGQDAAEQAADLADPDGYDPEGRVRPVGSQDPAGPVDAVGVDESGAGAAGAGEFDAEDPAADGAAYSGGRYEDDEAELGGISQLSLPARLIVALAVAAVAVGAAFHLGMVFLSITPTNTVSDEYSKELNDYVYPEFEQNWKLFAPNPVQDNNDAEVRAEIRKSDGTLTKTGWVDLTAMDIAKIRHDPIPSHTVQNELRRALGFYTDTHDNQDRAIGLRGDLSQEYMLHIVAQRLGPHLNGGSVQEVQVRLATTPVGSPPWDTQKIPTNTSYRVLPWWAVTAEDYT